MCGGSVSRRSSRFVCFLFRCRGPPRGGRSRRGCPLLTGLTGLSESLEQGRQLLGQGSRVNRIFLVLARLRAIPYHVTRLVVKDQRKNTVEVSMGVRSQMDFVGQNGTEHPRTGFYRLLDAIFVGIFQVCPGSSSASIRPMSSSCRMSDSCPNRRRRPGAAQDDRKNQYSLMNWESII